ncbi:APC family permease [Rothia sp. AR01]|uniref:APC family permease n=1 Tax=Rothia santali TaxID=2949643 RepID=A0A9X2HHY3_9MICC|nr:APC family permease [Rothia santali]MCP3425208.1 APC family permease [Rothia santali]
MTIHPETKSIALGKFEQSDGHMQRKIGLWQLIAIAVTVQIGASWLLAPLATAGLAGPAAILTWVIGGVLFTVMAAPWLETSTALPRTGISVRGPQFTHGSLLGWMNGWGYMIACITLPPIEALAALTYVGGQFPKLGLLHSVEGVTMLTWPNGILAAAALIVVFFMLNIYGVKILAKTSAWVSLWKILIPIVVAVLLFFSFNSENFTQYGGFAPMGASSIFHAMTTGGVIFAFNAIRVIADFGGESVNPRKHLPIAIVIGGLIIPLVIYLALQIGFLGVIDWGDMGVAPGNWEGLNAGAWAASPLVNALAVAGFAWFGVILLIDAAAAPAVTGLTFMGIAGRTTYANSVNGALPRIFQRLNKYGVPWFSLVMCTVVSMFFLFPAPSWYQMVGLVSTALVISYLMGGPILMVLRRTAPEITRPIRLPAAWLFCAAAHVASMLVVYYAGWWTLVNLLTIFFFGLPIAAFYLGPRMGWFTKTIGGVIGTASLVAWIALASASGWVLTAGTTKRPGGLQDWTYIILFTVVVAVTWTVLHIASNKDGRRQIAAAAWLPASLILTLIAAYLTDTTNGKEKLLNDGWTAAIVILGGILSFIWASRSGISTAEIRDVVESEAELREAEAHLTK